MMKANIYLDIDGVILANDKQAALHADEFIRYIVEHYPVYWLTTHCRNPGDDPVLMLSRCFKEKTLILLKQIKPAYWDTLKTEAIDFDSEFMWFDDDLLESEKEKLEKRSVLDSWVEIDLVKDPHQLSEILSLLTGFVA